MEITKWKQMIETEQLESKGMLPLQGDEWCLLLLTQGDAIGLEYTGLSARRNE